MPESQNPITVLIENLFEYIKHNLSADYGEYQEIDVLRQLSQHNPPLIPEYDPADSLQLFQVHFLLFHCLYKLQLHWLKHNKAYLQIGLAKFQVTPIMASDKQVGNALTDADPMQAYYLDLNNLYSTDQNQVERMLANFWQKFQQYCHSDQYIQACNTLEVRPESSLHVKKQRYKRLCALHHPDKGGDVSTIQQINQAWTVIKG
ncbi:DnaJ-class molecular chaperone [Catenovulum agarivorans DS-2]|uniref:DnaJ-class molecular chaperone n=1 Tax=Catenovulum agarivorans DS-2 TaxID=1328313 RepID=W7QQL5_9ALTE|nr:DNA-J related domain-containing protein [Catenovulum agarivorans]EWH11287.1 DnaJ-class molecular chaperone [Catenovulum agarivorans DS-2]